MLSSEFLAADPRFVETPGRLDDAHERFALADTAPPVGWTRQDRGVWVAWRPRVLALPAQGWKIHVSATLDGAQETIETVADYCVGAGVPFKFLRSRPIVLLLNAKYASRGSSGKVLTVYPPAADALESILTELSALLGGRPGPYILSDLRWEDGPLYLRYGAFVERYCLSDTGQVEAAMAAPDGTLVPDLREPVFQAPQWAPMPAFIDKCLQRAAGAGAQLPYQVEEALHFSNGGGVYRAVDPVTGGRVVLREARPHAGLDSGGQDAVDRLEREHRILSRLAGLDAVPALLDRFTVWEHEFLAEEYVEGDLLPSCLAIRHPLIYPDPTAEELRAYTDWALSTIDAIEQALAQIHERGIVYGDLHPHNVIVRPDGRVALIDFEQAFELDEEWSPGLGAQGFIAPWAREGTALDRYALACLRLAIFCPLTQLMALEPAAVHTLVRVITDRFPVPADFGPGVLAELAPGGGARGLAVLPVLPILPVLPVASATTAAATTRLGPHAPSDPHAPVDHHLPDERDLAAAILASATPDRADRLFPGDIAQFGDWGVSLAYGAAGILWTLATTGACPAADLSPGVDWLVDAAERVPYPAPGLYQGMHGVAWVLDVLGRRDEAQELLERTAPLTPEMLNADLFHGLAGIGLTHLYFAQHASSADQRERALRQALALGDRLSRAVTQDAHDQVHALDHAHDHEFAPLGVGLQYGWSGVAAFLVRLYRATGDVRLLDAAITAVRRDLDRCVVADKDTLQVRDGALNLLYLGTGSAGIALVLHDILAHREDAELADARRRILASLRAEFVFQSGLFEGRAGFLVAADHLCGPDDKQTADAVIELHLRRLNWHAVSNSGHAAYPGRGNLRLSMDLATGTAGVLLAAHAARVRPGGVLPLLGGTPGGAVARETTDMKGGEY